MLVLLYIYSEHVTGRHAFERPQFPAFDAQIVFQYYHREEKAMINLRIFITILYRVLFPFGDTSRQVSFYLCYLLNTKEDRTMFVLTCVTKWKAPIVHSLSI